MAKKTIWSKLKKAFKKQTSSNLKKDSGTSTKKTSSSKSSSSKSSSSKTSSQSTTRNAYKSTIEAKQNKIQEAFKADQSAKLKQSAQTASQRTAQRQTQKSNAVKNDVKMAMQKANVESNKKKQTNAVNNDLKTKRNQQNLQAKAKEKERKKKVQAEWNKASEQIAKEQGFSSAGQARKQGSAQMTANDIKYGQKKNDAAYSAVKGVASGASAGLTDLTKYVAAPEIREALETAEKNQTTEGKWAEGIGNLAGSMVSIGATAGASKKVGEAAIKGAGKLAGRDLSEEAVVSRLAPILENKAAKLSAKGGVKITGEDLAKSMFKEYAEDIGMNIGGWGQVQALTEAADAKANGESATKAYAKAQAANILMGIPVNNFVAGREAINGVKGAINKARVASKADNVLNPDYNLYLKNGDDAVEKVSTSKTKQSQYIVHTDEDVQAKINAKAKWQKDTLDSSVREKGKQLAYKSEEYSKIYDKIQELEKELKEIRKKETEKWAATNSSENNTLMTNDVYVDKYYSGLRKTSTDFRKNNIDPLYSELQKIEKKYATNAIKEYNKSVKKAEAELANEAKNTNFYSEVRHDDGTINKVAAKDRAEAESLVNNSRGFGYDARLVAEPKSKADAEIKTESNSKSSITAKGVESAESKADAIRAELEKPVTRQKNVGITTKEGKQIADLKNRNIVNNATKDLDNSKHYKQGVDGLVDAEESYIEKSARLEELNAKNLLTKEEQAEVKSLKKSLDEMKTPDEWNAVNNAKIAELEKSAKAQSKSSKSKPVTKKSKSLSKEAKAKSQLQMPEGQKTMKSELSKVDDSVDYSKREPLTYEQAKKHGKLYREHRGVDENGKQLSQTAYSSIFYTNDTSQRKALADKIANSDEFLYEFKGHKDNIKKAAERVAKDPQTYISKASTIAKEGTSTKTMVDDSYDMYALSEYVGARLGKTDLSNAERTALERIDEDCQTALKQMTSPSGQTLELRGHFVKTSPESRTRMGVRDLCDILGKNKKFLKENNITTTNKTDKRYQIEEFIRNNEALDGYVKNLYEAKGAENIEKAYADLLLAANKVIKPSAYELSQEWRYLAMLGNPKTHIRNFVGNKVFSAVREASNSVAYGIEKGLKDSGKLGDDYVMTKGAFSTEAYKQARMKEPTDEIGKQAKDEWDSLFSYMQNSDPKYEAMLLKNYPASTPVGKFVRKLSNFSSDMLEKADFSAMEKNFREAYYKAVKSNSADGKALTDAQLSRIAEAARDEALRSTFREASEVSKILNRLTKSVSDADASFGEKAVGVVTNAVLPYIKTPANVLKQSFKYSPAGLIEGVAKINGAIKSGDAKAINDAIEDIASGTVGTGLAVIGMLFGMNSDMVTTSAGDDAAAKFKKQNGVQDYSIRIGDYTFTLDWLTPTASTFFAGAELGNVLKNSSNSTGFDLVDNLGSVVSKVLEPVLETSMLSGLNDAFESTVNNYSESDDMAISRFLKNIAYSYVSSYIPTIQGQATRTLYSADKQIVGDTDFEYNLNMLKSKAGLANVGKNPLGDATDAYGNVKNKKETIGDYAWSAAKNFIIPTNIQKVTLTDDDKKMINIYNKAVASGMDSQTAAMMFPKQSYVREFVVGKKTSGQTNVTMTNKVLSEYNQAKTHAGKEAYTALMSSKYFDGYSKSEKQAIINSAPKTLQAAVGNIMKMSEFKNLSVEEQSKLLARVINTGGDTAIGSIKEQELTAWKALGKSETNYLFKNDLTARLQNNYKEYKDVVSKKDFLWFAENALSDKDTYTKASMLTALATRDDLTNEQKAALYNSFKASNAKEYGSSSSGSSGSGSSSKSSTADIDTSAYKTKKFTPKSSSSTTSKGYTLKVKSNVSNKATPPELEEFKFKI